MKIIPIFFYHEKWAVVIRKFVYSSDGVEKMGPLRGDGKAHLICSFNKLKFLVEKMGPLRGDGKANVVIAKYIGQKVEKMGPLRGDGKRIGDF